jgi:hypothetical protein
VRLWPAPAPAAESPDLPPRRLEATIYLPTVDNQGRPLGAEWDDALALLTAEFDGATVGPPLEGCWQDGGGRLRREPVRPVTVSFGRDRLARFRAAADAVGRRLGQEAVYARYEEPRVELRPTGGGP